jgi:hypothetical protein
VTTVVRTAILPVVFAAALGGASCSGRANPPGNETTKPTYDTTTGKLTQLTYDANKNGKVDTWTDMDGTRPLQSRIDTDEDGTIDRWEYYDGKGGLAKVGFSRQKNGKVDAWVFSGPGGKVLRVETEDDTNADGRPDKWEMYVDDVLQSSAMDEDGDGRPDRRLTYEGGTLVLIESEPDSSGAFRTHVVVR